MRDKPLNKFTVINLQCSWQCWYVSLVRFVITCVFHTWLRITRPYHNLSQPWEQAYPPAYSRSSIYFSLKSTSMHSSTREFINTTNSHVFSLFYLAGWSAGSAINCPSEPPIYHKSTGVYQYGDPDSDYVSPSDLSFEYFPQYPNPSGVLCNERVYACARSCECSLAHTHPSCVCRYVCMCVCVYVYVYVFCTCTSVGNPPSPPPFFLLKLRTRGSGSRSCGKEGWTLMC